MFSMYIGKKGEGIHVCRKTKYNKFCWNSETNSFEQANTNSSSYRKGIIAHSHMNNDSDDESSNQIETNSKQSFKHRKVKGLISCDL